MNFEAFIQIQTRKTFFILQYFLFIPNQPFRFGKRLGIPVLLFVYYLKIDLPTRLMISENELMSNRNETLD